MSLQSTSDGIGGQNKWLRSYRNYQSTKMTTATINYWNGDKVTLCCEKQGGLWERKLIPMDKVIKIFGLTHPGSDNYAIIG